MPLRESQDSDLEFLNEMLYEALADPTIKKALAGWGTREGDTAVVAAKDSRPIGAAWYRYWTDDNNIRGYTKEEIPVLVIGVQRDYRHRGVGTKMIEWLIDHASKQAIPEISLMVSKDNYAINLYRRQGFVEYADKGQSLLMVCKIL